MTLIANTATDKLPSVEMLESLAARNNGRCLSTEYINARAKYLWECDLGHHWLASSDSVKRGSWCKSCRSREGAAKFKTTISDYQKIAKSRGGRCLSESAKNKESKLQWECQQGHKWFATGGSVKNGGTWCAVCSGRSPNNLEEMVAIASAKGGKCLSTTYVNKESKLKWQCCNGHQWYATAGSVKNGDSWCRVCSRKESGLKKRDTIEEMQEVALKKKGRCLSDKYEGQNVHLQWQCEFGHLWEASPSSVKGTGSWCPVCSGNKRLTVADLQMTAASRGGRLVSTTVKNTEQLLTWECSNGHRWEAKSSNIRFGKWCPQCQSYQGESIVRAVLEQLTGKKFPKVRPSWLVNPSTGKKLEIDGFCEALAIGFEHHGSQHYNLQTHFISEQEILDKRQEVDSLKVALCKERGVSILVVPEVPLLTSLDELEGMVKEFLGLHKLDFDKDFRVSRLNVDTLQHNKALESLRTAVTARGGQLLSSIYVSSNSKVIIQCKQGHVWEAKPDKLKSGQWCKQCAGMQKGTIEEMNALAAKHQGVCLSTEYVSGKDNLRWRCHAGHEWLATPSSIKNAGTWCRQCAGLRKLTIDDMRMLAASKGGLCLSESYATKDSKLQWQCVNGHSWFATGGSVRNSGTWCPICARSRKLMIET